MTTKFDITFRDNAQRLDIMLSRYAPFSPIFAVKMLANDRRKHDWTDLPLGKALRLINELHQLDHIRTSYIEVSGYAQENDK